MERELISLDPDPVIEAFKKDVDRTLFRENLKLTHLERLRKGMERARLAEEARAGIREEQQKT